MSTVFRRPAVTAAVLAVLAVILQVQTAGADDLVGSSQFLCSPVEAAVCSEDGECVVDLPWDLNIPQFVEVDVEARRLSTTAASGLNRATPIEHLSRKDGTIVFHGFEMGRAFSWVINEQTGHVTVAIAVDGVAVAVFGACTPIGARAEEEAAP